MDSKTSRSVSHHGDRSGGQKSDRKAFPVNVDYSVMLQKMGEEFEFRWKANPVSPTNSLEGFDQLALLGTGSFGKVKLVRHKVTGNYYAAKMLLKDQIVRTKQVVNVKNEKRVLYSINFPNLTSIVFSSKDNDYLYLGMHFINGGELFQYHRKVRKFNEKQARFYASQVFLGLEYMHNVDLIYRDLKPENIMIDAKGYLKITDFGFTKRVEGRTLSLCGTPEYLAPEIIQSRPYGTSVDWWAFGILIFEFVAGCSPFSEYSRDVMVMYSKIVDGCYKCPVYFSPEFVDLVDHLLQTDQSKRLGSLINGNKDIKNHTWFKPVDWYAILNQEIFAPYVPNIAHMEDLSNFEHIVDTKPMPKSKTPKHAELFADF